MQGSALVGTAGITLYVVDENLTKSKQCRLKYLSSPEEISSSVDVQKILMNGFLHYIENYLHFVSYFINGLDFKGRQRIQSQIQKQIKEIHSTINPIPVPKFERYALSWTFTIKTNYN